MPPGSSWTVVEVSKIAAQGQQGAAREQANDLQFVDRLAGSQRCDVLLSAGALHYMRSPCQGCSKPCRICLVTSYSTSCRSPAGRICWTLQNYGPAVTPTRLFNEQQFLDYFKRARLSVARALGTCRTWISSSRFTPSASSSNLQASLSRRH